MTEPLRLRVWNDEPTEIPLRFSEAEKACTVDLRCLPGASGVHLVLFDFTGAVQLRAEVEAAPGDVVSAHFELDEQGAPHVWSRGRNVILLPVDERYDPLAPIRPLAADAPLDLTIVVDGTLRSWADKNPCLLDHNDLWAEHVDQLIDFAERIVEGRQLRAAVIAFGDQEPPEVTAPDLRPRYRLYPPEEDRTLRTLDLERLRERLVAIPSSPGADYVDALADALDACVRLHWDDDSRKVVVLTGDSPGHSLLHVLPKGADLGVRRLDVDTQVSALHGQGVEMVTIYHAPAADRNLYALSPQRELLDGARSQYTRLASLPELAFEAAGFQPERAAARLEQVATPIARGAALGVPVNGRR